ncbi:MAG: DM13 domain-containing protein [Propylenella sp.]
MAVILLSRRLECCHPPRFHVMISVVTGAGQRMWKAIAVTALVAGLVGFVAGNAFWYLASPLWIDRVVSEELPAALQMSKEREGAFVDADSVHRGGGIATIFSLVGGSSVLRFTDFEVTNGPDLKVWLVKADSIASSGDVRASEWVSLGPLKGNKGDQNYLIPEDVNVGDYGSVVIWCEQFGVLFSAARLDPTI